MDLAVQSTDEPKLRSGTTVGLTLVEYFLGDFILENLRGRGLLQDLVLSEGEEAFEEVLAPREANDQTLPREEGAVEEASKTLVYSAGFTSA